MTGKGTANCPECEELVYGERGFSDCGCGEDNCDCERHWPGDWYYLDEEYTCEHCGARLIAVGDVENVTLDLVEENET